MAGQWELDTLSAINETRNSLGLPSLEWSDELEFEARRFWSRPSSALRVVKACDCPHWTSPKALAELLWCEELARYFVQRAAVVIFNDDVTHCAVASD